MAAPAPPPRLRPAELARPAAIHLASRVVVLSAMWFASRLEPTADVGQLASRWDGGWYLLAASAGYPSEIPDAAGSTLAFFPVYPLLVRAASELPGTTPLGAGLLVGGIAALVASVAIWVLGRHLCGVEVADRAVALFAFFPGSFVLSMVYAEGVMLALSAGCLYALVRRRWLVAGLLAAVGTAARPNAVALIAACGVGAFVAVRRQGSWRALAAPLLAPLGIVGFFGFLWARTGVATAWFDAQRAGWDERIAPFAVADDLRRFVLDPLTDVNGTVVVAGTIVTAVVIVLLLRSALPPEVVAFALVVLGLALVSETLGPRPRFVLTAFPVFYVLAARLRAVGFSVVLGASACVLGGFTVLSVTTLLATP